MHSQGVSQSKIEGGGGGGGDKRKSSIYHSLVDLTYCLIRIIHDKLNNTLDSESSPVPSIFLDKSQGESSMSTVLLDCAQVGQTPAPRAATEITVGYTGSCDTCVIVTTRYMHACRLQCGPARLAGAQGQS